MKSCSKFKGRPGKRTDEPAVANAVYALLRSAIDIVEDMPADEMYRLLEADSPSSEEEVNEIPAFGDVKEE